MCAKVYFFFVSVLSLAERAEKFSAVKVLFQKKKCSITVQLF